LLKKKSFKVVSLGESVRIHNRLGSASVQKLLFSHCTALIVPACIDQERGILHKRQLQHRYLYDYPFIHGISELTMNAFHFSATSEDIQV